MRISLCIPAWDYERLAAAADSGRSRLPPWERTGQGVLPSLALQHLATTVEGHGHSVEVDEGFGAEATAQAQRIIAARPDVLGLSVVTPLWPRAHALIRRVRAALPEIRIAVGGAHAEWRREKLLDDCAELDAVFAGPSDESFLRWVESGGRARALVEAGSAPVGLGRARRPGWATRLAQRVPWQRYTPNLMFAGARPFATSITATGCPFRCSFCAVSRHTKSARFRDAEELLEELVALSRLGIRTVNFMDDAPIFAQPGKTPVALLEAMARETPGLRWSIYLNRFDVDEERLHLMRRAGCWRVLVMAESGSPRVLERVKGHPEDPAQIASQVERLARAGIEPCVRFQLGFPGETVADAEETLRFSRTLPAVIVSFVRAMVYPGSTVALDTRSLEDVPLERWSYYGRPFVPDAMTERERDALLRRGLFGFYARPDRALGLLRAQGLTGARELVRRAAFGSLR